MGTHVAQSYANLFIGQFEHKCITSGNPYLLKIKPCKRYIDDLFFLCNREEALSFKESLKNN